MFNKMQMPEIPDYVARNMNKIKETGIHDLNLRDIGLLLLEWEEKYGEKGGYTECIETVEWLSENHMYFEQIKQHLLV